ncbi:MAG: hypothetical protein FJ009_08850 [Chloroflexi bacterium]|nr:hypothetical protein [Chloroflexota bacterium]
MAKPTMKVLELGEDKLLLVAVVNKKQLQAIYGVFEPLSRSWRGQYQPLAKAIVDAYHNWKGKSA